MEDKNIVIEVLKAIKNYRMLLERMGEIGFTHEEGSFVEEVVDSLSKALSFAVRIPDKNGCTENNGCAECVKNNEICDWLFDYIDEIVKSLAKDHITIEEAYEMLKHPQISNIEIIQIPED